jgi:hypothetical protein
MNDTIKYIYLNLLVAKSWTFVLLTHNDGWFVMGTLKDDMNLQKAAEIVREYRV